MQKLAMHTSNIADQNFQKLAILFPQAVTESVVDGEVVRVVDKDVLMQEIGAHVVEGNQQRYQFTWPDKAKTVQSANQPLYKTLRPYREESVNFDTTENLYIEGDNLEVLKLLQETYLNKVKMIYIDPPYNTGNDFVYNDKFSIDKDDYDDINGSYDDEGNRLFKNTESNGRFHTDWLNMMYPRLKVARDLLSDDGVIFMSIDDNEVQNLRKIADEIFGVDNFVTQFIWKRRQNVDSRSKNGASVDHEYGIVYSRRASGRIRGADKDMNKYSNPDNDPRGPWMSADMTGLATKEQRPNLHYDLVNPNTEINYGCPVTGWRYERKRMAQLIDNNEVLFPKSPDGRPRRKKFRSSLESEFTGKSSILTTVFNTQATRELRELFSGVDYFDFPKPVELIKEYLIQGSEHNSIILDFFSGSATTAHAVMQLNAEDGGKRKFIMVQVPEATDEKSEARKTGYANICEIGKERIRRAGAKIKGTTDEGNKPLVYGQSLWSGGQKLGGNNKKVPDIGFRVLKVDDTNMTKVYYSPKEYNQEMLSLLDTNIKVDRTPEDLLFQVMLELGIPLSSRIKETTLHGKKVFEVYCAEALFLMASFDDNLNEAIITEIAQKMPYDFVMRDSSQASDSVATNFEEIFKLYSPTTRVRVL